MLDRDDGPRLPPSPVRWWFVIACWLGVTLASFTSPFLSIFPGAIGCLFVAIGGLDGLRSYLARRDPVVSPGSRWVSSVVAVIAVASVVGAISARVPSMGFQVRPGVIAFEYGLSRLIAPAAFATIAFLAVCALLVPSLRRIAMLVTAIFITWPFLIAIRALREPLMDIDQEFVVVAPWAIYAYTAAAGITSIAAIALMRRANQLAALPALPRAQLAATS